MGGIEVNTAKVTDRGFEYDRRWILVDQKYRFISQRELPRMALLHTELSEEGLKIINSESPNDYVIVPYSSPIDRHDDVTIWNATCRAQHVPADINEWLSEFLQAECKLMYMPDSTKRPVDTTSGYKPEGKLTSFADAYPFLLIGEASVEDLNARYDGPEYFDIVRFRPNMVFSGGTPYEEDEIGNFVINNIQFTGLEKCARCNIPNVNPETGIPHDKKQPLATLAKYRIQDRKINFGMNVVHSGTGTVHLGDELVKVR